MIGRLAPGRGRDDGAVAVELALVLPILVILVFGIIQFGIIFAQKLALSNAAREAARAGSVALNAPAQMTCQEIADQVRSTVGTVALDTSNVDVVISQQDDSTTPPTVTQICSGNTGGTMSPTNGSSPNTPCTALTSTPSANRELLVQVSTPATIAIPFSVSTGVTLTGLGAYRCEYQ